MWIFLFACATATLLYVCRREHADHDWLAFLRVFVSAIVVVCVLQKTKVARLQACATVRGDVIVLARVRVHNDPLCADDQAAEREKVKKHQ